MKYLGGGSLATRLKGGAVPVKAALKVIGDIAARIRRTRDHRADASGVYAALASAQRRTAPVSADLGRRIMEKRNASYKEGNRRG